MADTENPPKSGTMRALLREKRKRGRPKLAEARKTVQVELAPSQKEMLSALGGRLPQPFGRSDVAGLAIDVLAKQVDSLRAALSDRERELPEGITDIRGLYYLWDMQPPEIVGPSKWTSLRLTQSQWVEINNLHGMLRALFGSNRSEVFTLALAVLDHRMPDPLSAELFTDLNTIYHHLIAE